MANSLVGTSDDPDLGAGRVVGDLADGVVSLSPALQEKTVMPLEGIEREFGEANNHAGEGSAREGLDIEHASELQLEGIVGGPEEVNFLGGKRREEGRDEKGIALREAIAEMEGGEEEDHLSLHLGRNVGPDIARDSVDGDIT